MKQESHEVLQAKIEKALDGYPPDGRMSPQEQRALASVYSKAKSIFEWGMGASALIAAEFEVPRLYAVDSSLDYVQSCRNRSRNPAYQMEFVDIGPTGAWGYPVEEKHKDRWPDYYNVIDNLEPFDVYLVDGRFRVACACKALLHGHSSSHILLHDAWRRSYAVLETVAEEIHRIGKLAMFQRKTEAKDEEIQAILTEHAFDPE